MMKRTYRMLKKGAGRIQCVQDAVQPPRLARDPLEELVGKVNSEEAKMTGMTPDGLI
jgi:hypothetical protein